MGEIVTSADHIVGWCVCGYEKMSRMSVCESVVLWCNVWVILRWENVKMKPDVGISRLLLTSTMGSVRFNVTTDRQITINDTCAFTTCGLYRKLGFSPRIFRAETKDWGSAPSSLVVPKINIFIKISYPVGDRTRDRCMRGSNSALCHSGGLYCDVFVYLFASFKCYL